MSSERFLRHWPTVLLGVIVAAVLFAAIVTYRVNQNECAVVTMLGRIQQGSPGPGLHLRWPYPFQRVYKFDRRTRCFEGNAGKLEESTTADGQNVLIGTFVNYRISDPKLFFTSFERIGEAEKQLNNWMRDSRNAVFGRYRFAQIINTDPAKMKLGVMQDEILRELADRAAPFGLEIQFVGINVINVPTTISEEVFKRMIQERKVVAQDYLSRGAQEASDIRTKADQKRAEILTNAEATAKSIRAQGDAEAAKYYEVFKENPELAAFLRKLDSLRQIMKGRTTLVLDTNAAPFDLLKIGADKLAPAAGPVAH